MTYLTKRALRSMLDCLGEMSGRQLELETRRDGTHRVLELRHNRTRVLTDYHEPRVLALWIAGFESALTKNGARR